ncbi:helix-turn-helix domain-containing protein [Poseidonibacter ostreae]|uniref:helix-turn-helix domain-containing protein n=1 Tax=Poseidonibacter ostreae TaxID=2654171 RepID=UPI001D012F92|nr:helix-turn-helix domain-containing protein [Poseidonibacter ostreae]
MFLSKKEKMFLDLLILNQDKIVSYEKIERELWESEEEVMTSMALRTLVKNLRKKTSKEYIQNISGLGYKLVTKK